MRARLAFAALLIGLVAALLLIVPGLLRSLATARQAERVATGQGDAALSAGTAAIDTMATLGNSAAAADTIGKEGRDAIRAAPEGARGGAALDAACRLPLYQRDERCAGLRTVDPGGAARPR